MAVKEGPEVDERHEEYEVFYPLWKMARDAKKGEFAIKAAGEEYLPRLDKQTDEQYAAYVQRASFVGNTKRTIEALVGALFTQQPNIVSDSRLREAMAAIGVEEEPFTQILAKFADEVLTVGRVGALVDVQPDLSSGVQVNPYITTYCAESIINWRTTARNGRKELTFVVLEEKEEIIGDNIFDVEYQTVWRVLYLDNEGDYVVELWDRVEKPDEKGGLVVTFVMRPGGRYYPKKLGGGRMTYVPFVFINTNTITPDCEEPPLIGLVSVNVSHYRTSADYEHGLHYVALPTPVVKGVGNKQKPLVLGVTEAWVLPNEKSDAFLLEFSGEGMSALAANIASKERQMAVLAARFLEPPKAQSESGKSVELRSVGDTATLSSIADQLSAGATQLLRIVADWMLITDVPTVTWHREFFNLNVSVPDFTYFGGMVNDGKFYFGDLFEALKRAKWIPQDRTLEEHIKLIENSDLPMPKSKLLEMELQLEQQKQSQLPTPKDPSADTVSAG